MGWKPDAIVLFLPYSIVPKGIWEADIPRIGWAGEPDLQWQAYQQVLPACDLLIGDVSLAKRAQAFGWPRVVVSPMHGIEDRFAYSMPECERDIDILFVGNLHAAVQRERLPWLSRLASLGERWRVQIASGVSPEEYVALLRRARLVIDLSRRGHVSRRIPESVASGAVVLIPSHSRMTHHDFPHREWCLCWCESDLEAKVIKILQNEEERTPVNGAQRESISEVTFSHLWQKVVDRLTKNSLWQSKSLRADAITWIRTWQILYASAPVSPDHVAEVERLARENKTPEWLNLAALLTGRLAAGSRPTGHIFQRVLDLQRQASALAPSSILLQLNLAEVLAWGGEAAAAAQQARHALRVMELSDVDEAAPLLAHFPARFSTFRVEWDQAGWRYWTSPKDEQAQKHKLLYWRLNALLAELTGIIVHGYEAVRVRPDLASTQAALGLQLARQGQPVEALEPLRQAVALNPLDQVAAQALWQQLGAIGATIKQRQFAEERRALHRVAPHLVPAEPWFSSSSIPRLEHAGVVSVIIPCCNGLADTQGCTASLMAHTRLAFELIIIDNGSGDGTTEFGQQLREELGAERARLHRNEVNQGFAKACNQGASIAQGEFMLFLNNDTLVTPGWLEGLLRPLFADTQVGLVGPMSNCAPPPQQVEPGYSDIADLDRFAAEHCQRFRGQTEAIGRLSGFCLLVRRKLFDELGGFDERFGLGFFGDEDFSRRVREKGNSLLIAKEVFIHHFGGRTCTRLGLDRQCLLEANRAKFVEKWGLDALNGYRSALLPTSALPSDARSAKPARYRTSLTMIVRNEEKHLPDCLRSVVSLVDEVVIADTGSKDRTVEIAASFGAKVVSFPWIDHFAAARNAALAAATGDYILWLDADDRLDEENRIKARKLLNDLGAPRDAYAFKVRSALDPQGNAVRLLDQVRLFPRLPQIRWEYRIHEQILPAVRRFGGDVRWTDLIVDHVGYVDSRIRAEKLRRNIRLLRLDEAERPFDSFTLFNLGWTLLDLGEMEEAILRLRRSLDQATPDSSILRKIYVLLTQAYRQIKQFGRALEICRQGRLRCPDDLELPFEEALILRDQGDLASAEQCLLQLLAIPPQRYFASVDPELKPVRVKALLAELSRRDGRFADAVRYCREGIVARPRFVPLWLEWAEVCLLGKQWAELENVAIGMASEAGQPLEAEILRARGERGRGDFAAARRRLECLTAQVPDALGPRVLLSHVLLQEGKDLPATELALLDILRLDPQNSEAQHNLSVLRSKRGNSSA